MRALDDWDGLRTAAGRARELEVELRAAWRDPDRRDDRLRLRLAYLAALGEAVIWTARIIGEATAAGGPCPLCELGDAP